MLKGLILINAYSDLKSALNQSLRLKEELDNLGVQADIKRNNFFAAYVNGNGDINSAVSGYDFCIYLDKDKYISAMLQKCGIRLFNSHKAICDCDDKMVTAIELANRGIRMPETLSGFLCYDVDAQISEETLDYIECALGYPMVVKTSYGSLGKGVYKADDRSSLYKIMCELKCEPHLFQKYIAESAGKDLRVIVVGGECIAAMKRTSQKDFRSNIELGGIGQKYEITQEIKDICKKVSDALCLDYCGVDILFGKDGYLVCEVNSNAFFGGIEGVTGVNVAKAYAEYIVKELKK
ncbi:MAG: RimK family alpha-L-glutamate ligase [Clostridia bacterium]|nr:RimK family alpha-L-glutamate ligase [Clostridia bacterium]